MTKLTLGAIAAVAGAMFFLMTYFTVNAYERAVVTRFGQVVSIEGEGKAIRAEAKGQADANLLVAQAAAKAIQLKGEAEAAAIKAQAEALAQNVRLVELRKAERWNGALPQSMLSNVVPFMSVDQQVQK
ncbi:MAG: hypothetical protein IT562_24195 [Alphaproteobacteria bacterium]|nr:hypothetical protein [Alphaproteobacteria bacterium]